MNLRDGSRTLLKRATPWTRISPSPDGSRVVAYDAVERAWMAVCPADGTVTDLTGDLDVAFFDEKDDHPCLPPPTGGATWFNDDRRVTLRDRYDIWVFDLDGQAQRLI